MKNIRFFLLATTFFLPFIAQLNASDSNDEMEKSNAPVIPLSDDEKIIFETQLLNALRANRFSCRKPRIEIAQLKPWFSGNHQPGELVDRLLKYWDTPDNNALLEYIIRLIKQNHPLYNQMVRLLALIVENITADRQTPLHLAAQFGHTKLAQALIDAGAYIDEEDINWQTPLHLAVQFGHTKVAQALIHASVYRDDENVVQDFDKEDVKQQTPLHLAAQLGHTKLVQALIDAGARLHASNIIGETPADVALRAGHIELSQNLRTASSLRFMGCRPHR